MGVQETQRRRMGMRPATGLQLTRGGLEPAKRFIPRVRRERRLDLARRAHTSRKMPGLQKSRENRAAKQEPFPRRQPKLHSRSLIQFAFYGLDREAEMLGDLCGRPLPF